MRIFPGVHYSMGGLWTTYTPKSDLRGMELGAANSMMTNIEGLYAFGEVNYQFHGANRLGANALLSCIFDGLFSGVGVANYVNGLDRSAASLEATAYESAKQSEESVVERLVNGDGTENPYLIGRELGEEMTAACTVVKSEPRLMQAREKLAELRDRYGRLRLSDTGLWTNQNLSYARAVGDMLRLADAMIEGSILRKESRGSHYRTDFPTRHDGDFLRTSVARLDPASDRCSIAYEDVEVGLVVPRERNYAKTHAPAKEDSKSEAVAAT